MRACGGLGVVANALGRPEEDVNPMGLEFPLTEGLMGSNSGRIVAFRFF
jgi:hypothetical protein